VREEAREGKRRTATPGQNCCWKLPRGVAKAVSRAGFRAEVYRFPVRPPGERKYRRDVGRGREDKRVTEDEREISRQNAILDDDNPLDMKGRDFI